MNCLWLEPAWGELERRLSYAQATTMQGQSRQQHSPRYLMQSVVRLCSDPGPPNANSSRGNHGDRPNQGLQFVGRESLLEKLKYWPDARLVGA